MNKEISELEALVESKVRIITASIAIESYSTSQIYREVSYL